MFGLRFKVMLATVLAAAAPLAAYFTAEYYGAETRIEAAAKQALIDSTERSAQKVESWMESNRGGLESLAGVPGLLDGALSEDKTASKERMKISVANLSWVRAAYLTTADGQQVLRSNEEKLSKIGDRDYFKQARFGSLGQQLVISRATQLPVLNIARPVLDKDGKFAGAIAYTINVDSISKEVTNDKVGKTGFKFVVDNEGALMAHPKKSETELKNDALPVYATHPLWRVRPSGDETAVLQFDKDGEKFMGAISKAGNFYVASVIPMLEVDAPLVAQRNDAYIWFAVAMVLSMSLAFGIAEVLARPIRTLTSAAEDISMGKFNDAKLDSITAKDEIGLLAQSIKKLSHSVKIAMKQLESAAKSKDTTK